MTVRAGVARDLEAIAAKLEAAAFQAGDLGKLLGDGALEAAAPALRHLADDARDVAARLIAVDESRLEPRT